MKKIWIIGLVCLCAAFHSQAQVPAPQHIMAFMEASEQALQAMDETLLEQNLEDEDGGVNPFAGIPMRMKVVVSLFDVAEVQNLHVKVGTSQGASDLLDMQFSYTDPNSSPAPYTLRRNGKDITLLLGEYADLANYHIEVKVEDMDGELSPPIHFDSSQ